MQVRAIAPDGTASTLYSWSPQSQRNVTCLTMAGARGLLYADAAASALYTYTPANAPGTQAQVRVVGTPPIAGQCADGTPPLQ